MVDKRRFDPVQAPPDLPLRAQFVKSRRAVRLVSDDGTAFELPLHEFLDRIGIDAADVAPPRHYVVFAGTVDRPAGGSGDIVGTFATEEQARALFQQLRASRDHKWAQLVAFDARGRARAICWFGDTFRHVATPTGTPAVRATARRRVLRRLSVIAGGQGREPDRDDSRSRPA